MSQKLKIIINFILKAGSCSSNPNLTTTLGQNGINIKKFVDEFNKYSKDNYKEGLELRVKVYIFDDRTFTFTILGVPSSIFIKKYLYETNKNNKVLHFYKSLYLMNVPNNYIFNSKKNLPLILKGTLKSFNK